MDELLARVTQQALNHAIRSGIALTTTYALRQTARLVRRAECDDGGGHTAPDASLRELRVLQRRLEARVRILGPAIDLVEVVSARGNTSLETAVTLTKSLRWDIQNLGQQLAAANDAHDAQPLQPIIAAIKDLLTRIEEAIPLINLAITTSGANVSSALPTGLSPSRLLQASTFVTAGDAQYAATTATAGVQIGPTFTLTLYMLFAGHVRPQTAAEVRQTTWKEVMHKARVQLLRVPLSALDEPAVRTPAAERFAAPSRGDEFAYQMLIVEDLNDGRVHDEAEEASACGDVERAGMREPLPIHQISKIFYADTGKILNIGDDVETNSPVLLLKRDIAATPPRRMLRHEDMETFDPDQPALGSTKSPPDAEQSALDAQIQRESRASSVDPTPPNSQRIPPDLDPEWLAFEVFINDADTDSDSEPTSSPNRSASASPLVDHMSHLRLGTPQPQPSPDGTTTALVSSPALPQIRTSLSLLETLLRLLSLQQFQQASHLAIPDELLSFFLSEAAGTTGAAAGDDSTRRAMRANARQRVGFDPYDESPIKRHGEDYQRYRGGASQDGGGSPWNPDTDEGVDASYRRPWPSTEWSSPPSAPRSRARTVYDEGYETHRFSSEPAETPVATASERAAGRRRSKGKGEQSPSMHAQRLRDRGAKGSPLAVAQSSET